MKAIVSVDINWGIGYKGSLLKRISEDMKNFKKLTLGKIVVMGRETYDSLPGKQPLKDRTNIILTRNPEFAADGFVVCHSLDELIKELENYDTDDVFVIGGDSIYRLLLPYCTEAYVTKIDGEFTADRYFVRLDNDNEWMLESTGEAKSFDDIEFCFTKYVRKTGV